MIAKATTALGYSLLAVATAASLSYTNYAMDFLEITQCGMFVAGGLALLMMTRRRSVK